MYNAVATNVLGTAGAVCWSVQLIPQIIINYRRHHTTGLQPSMMLLWATAGTPLGIYNILSNFNIALRIQPQILTFLSLVTWAQCKYYSSNWRPAKAILVASAIGALLAGIEVGLVFALRTPQRNGVDWPMTLMATVRGISFLFVFIDALGDLTSLVAVLFEEHLNVLGMVIYGSELVLWLGVMACGGWFNLRPWVARYLRKRKERSIETEHSAEERVDGGRNAVMMHEHVSSTWSSEKKGDE
ncbi:hypothetical protein ABW21_db0208509 [Orbilia brochopaga]|nr:hypothetical protein ABW21_db0208509 [Drechslerella brochopaga]